MSSRLLQALRLVLIVALLVLSAAWRVAAEDPDTGSSTKNGPPPEPMAMDALGATDPTALIFPTSGFLGWNWDLAVPHKGIDIWSSLPASPPPGPEVRAVYRGIVKQIWRLTPAESWQPVTKTSSLAEKRDAQIVVLEHQNTNPVVVPGWGAQFYTYYMHMGKQSGTEIGHASESYISSQVYDRLADQQQIEAGFVLGRQGDVKANSNAPITHLHFSIIDKLNGESGGLSVNPLSFLMPGVANPTDKSVGMIYDGQVIHGKIVQVGESDFAGRRQFSVYFCAAQGQQATISMSKEGSESLDSYLELYSPDGSLLNNPGADDDRGGGRDALIDHQTLPLTGRYRIVARSYYDGNASEPQGRGDFALALSLGAGSTPGRLQVVSDLTLSDVTLEPGQDVTAEFRVRNVGGQAITVQKLLAGGRGPNCQDWSCTRWADFPTDGPFTLQPGQDRVYSRQARFWELGAGYFAEPVMQWPDNSWSGIDGANRVSFAVSAPGRLQVSSALSLSDTTLDIGQNVTATFQVRNVGGQAITVQKLLAGGRGPNCSDWSCSRYADFSADGPFTLQPGQTRSYSKTRSFAAAGGGYFAEPVMQWPDNSWSGIDGANRVPYTVSGPGRLQVSSALSLSDTTPNIGQTVTATFQVRNVGGQAITVQKLLAGGRGPDCSDWSCSRYADFPAEGSFTLQPGQTRTYSQNRIFGQLGSDYFAEPVMQHSNGSWSGIDSANRVRYTVGNSGLQVVSALSLSDTLPQRGQQVTATFKVKNNGSHAITVQELNAGGRGPDCSSWSCSRYADFPSDGPFTLQPGQERTYSKTRSFSNIGENYFAEPTVKIGDSWGGLTGANRVGFTVISENYATNKPVWASSQESSSYPASKAVDGRLDTRWSSAQSGSLGPQMMVIEVGNVNWNMVVVAWERAYAARWQLQYSDDNQSWHSLGTFYGGEGMQTLVDTERLHNHRWIGIYMETRAPGMNGYSIWDVGLFRNPALENAGAAGSLSDEWRLIPDEGLGEGGVTVGPALLLPEESSPTAAPTLAPTPIVPEEPSPTAAPTLVPTLASEEPSPTTAPTLAPTQAPPEEPSYIATPAATPEAHVDSWSMAKFSSSSASWFPTAPSAVLEPRG